MKTKFYLDKRTPVRILVPDSAGVEPTYPIKIALNSDGGSAYIPTGINVRESEWLSKPSPGQVINSPRKEAYNIKLMEKKLAVDKAVEVLRKRGELQGKSVSEIKDLVLKKLQADEYGEVGYEWPVVKCFDKFIGTKKRKGTAGVYESTRRKLLSYAGFTPRTTFRDITSGWLMDFESYLSETSPSANARGIHLRNIRAVFNYAISEELTGAAYPFKRFKIRAEQTRDRSLSAEDIRRLARVECSTALGKYRDIFLLSFYMCGLNLEDLLGLKDMKGGRIEIRRTKTGQPINMTVQPEALEIINRYRGKKYLLDVMEKCGNYKNYQRRINRYLKSLGKTYNPKTKDWEGEALIPDLSFYYARYSWATIAAELDIPERTIGAALAHSTAHTVTSIYTRVDMRRKVDAANRKVIDFCFKDLESQK